MLKNLKVYQKIWIWIPPILGLGFLFNTDFDFSVKAIDLKFQLSDFALMLSLFLFFSGLAYALFRQRKLNDYMSKMHLKLLIVGLTVYLLPFLLLALFFGTKNKIEANSALIESGMDSGLVLVMMLGIFILFMATLTYVINIIVSLFFSQHFQESSPISSDDVHVK